MARHFSKEHKPLRLVDLATCPVDFNEQAHTYTYLGNQLMGVTSLLKEKLFPGKYADVPEAILEKSREKGTIIHSLCETYNIFGSLDTQELRDYPELRHYIDLLKREQINPIANEYLVSDLESLATMIDFVDEWGNIYDIKTTRELDIDYVSWQLSLCAYLYELQNPKLKAGKLYAVHLRGKGASLVEVVPKPTEEVKALIEAYRQSQVFVPSLQQEQEQTLALIAQTEEQIIQFKQLIEDLEKQRKKGLESLTERMITTGTKAIETERLKLTLVLEQQRESLDTPTFKSEQPELWERYKKTTTTKAHVRLKLKSASASQQ